MDKNLQEEIEKRAGFYIREKDYRLDGFKTLIVSIIRTYPKLESLVRDNLFLLSQCYQAGLVDAGKKAREAHKILTELL